jgi:hypothetical protein
MAEGLSGSRNDPASPALFLIGGFGAILVGLALIARTGPSHPHRYNRVFGGYLSVVVGVVMICWSLFGLLA